MLATILWTLNALSSFHFLNNHFGRCAHVHIQRWQWQDSLGSNCEQVIQRAWEIIFTYEEYNTYNKSWPKMYATLNGNKWCCIRLLVQFHDKIHTVIKAKASLMKYLCASGSVLYKKSSHLYLYGTLYNTYCQSSFTMSNRKIDCQ